MPNRYRLKAASLEEIRRKVELQHGPAARIVSAERVINPGIAGLFAGDRYEAIVEVLPGYEVITAEVLPDADVPAKTPAQAGTAGGEAPNGATAAGTVPPSSYPPADAAAADLPGASSHQLQGAAIAALLADADAAELSLHDRPASPGVSTESPNFADMLEQLGAGLHLPATAAPAPDTSAAPIPAPARPRLPNPAPLTGIGDLMVLIGLGEDALDIALAMSTAAGGSDVRTAGKLSAYGHLHVDGRMEATAARAHAVVTERTVLVAFGLGKAGQAAGQIDAVAALSPDQLWIVVDAGRKHEDTARWVEALAARLDVYAVAVVGAAETGSPESVYRLGLPVGWVDTHPAGSVPL